MPNYLDPKDPRAEALTSTKGYGTSKYQNRLAERAHAHVMDGDTLDTIYDGENVRFDQVALDLLDDGTSDRVILRYDSQGFIDIEWNGSPLEWQVRGQAYWDYLRTEYERDQD